MIDPLHQFLIKKILPLQIAGIDISFTTASLAMVLSVTIICIFMLFATKNNNPIPSRLTVCLEIIHDLIFNMLKNYAGKESLKYFPFVFSLFLFILFGNLLGLIPYNYTFTSQLVVTFTLAAIVFLLVTCIGIIKNGKKFFKQFLPDGIPLYIAPILIPVELISFLFRPISLSIRLFANMVAGHIMLKVFSSFGVILMGSAFIPVSIVPLFINISLTAFEFLVACIQAYVFTILTCIYLNDALNLH